MIEKVKNMWPDWEVVDNLGSGTFGSVYEIHRKIFSHTDKAALKVLSIPKSKSDIQELLYNGYDQKSITERFKNHLEDIVKEYALMSELKGCANVVYSDDIRYIQHPDGIGWDIYIKMELLHPIISVLKNPVDQQQVIKIGIDICNALELCKEKNIIHRDIKPQNLFVSDDGTFKLGDFGIAKTAERTMGGTKTGTFNYMAPEVYNNQPYGAAADQYSLGMVLYWLLNERRMPFFPLPPEVPTATQEEQARQKRMSGEVPPAPKHGSDAMKSIVMRAIAPNPADRFPSPTDMRHSLKLLEQIENGYVPTELVSEVEAYFKEEEYRPFEPSIDPGVVVVEDFSDESLVELMRDLMDEPVEDIVFKDEEIPSADSTMGNSWGFDEGSIGPGAGFNDLFDDFKSEGTVGVKNEVPKKENHEEIRPKSEPKRDTASPLKPVNINNMVDPGMVFYELLREERFDPALSLSGYTCKFYVDGGNTPEMIKEKWYFNEPRIVCDNGSQFSPLPAKSGIHQLTVKMFGPNDPECTGQPAYICGPMNFEVRPKLTTRIKVTRPTSKTPMSVEVSSDFAEPVTVTAACNSSVSDTAVDVEKAKAEKKVAEIFGEFFSKQVAEEKKGTVVFSALNDSHSPLSLAHGCFYKFTVDGGNVVVDGKVTQYNNYIVKCGRKEEKVVGSATIGKPHKVNLKIYSYSDPECKGRVVHEFGPVAFEVKEGYTTRIKANRPSPRQKINVTVSYEKN